MQATYLILDGSGVIQSYSGQIPNNLVIPDTCTGFSNNLFSGIANLTAITIPGTFTNLGTSVFQDCSNLTSIIITGILPSYVFDVYPFSTLQSNNPGTILTTAENTNYNSLIAAGQVPLNWDISNTYIVMTGGGPGHMPPDKILDVSATSGEDSQTTVTWANPNDNSIQSYTVTATDNRTNTPVAVASVVWLDGPLSVVVTGLISTVEYTITVIASNGNGISDPSDPVTCTPTPAEPSNESTVPTNYSSSPTATSNEDGQSIVSWSPPPSDGGSAITAYRLTIYYSSPLTFNTSDVFPLASLTYNSQTGKYSHVFTGLTNGTAYKFTIIAINVNGSTAESPYSAAVTPTPPTSPPTNVKAISGVSGEVTVQWTAASGSVDNYTVKTYNGATLVSTNTTSSTSYRVTSLTNFTYYTFAVTANKNSKSSSIGTGDATYYNSGNAYDGPVYAIPNTTNSPTGSPPLHPTGVNAVAGIGDATITWTAPQYHGNQPITRYIITSSPDNQTATWTNGSLSAVVGNLRTGISYTFTVMARNANGNGPASSPSSSIIGVQCFPEGTRITTQSGPVLVEDLKTGDLVLTADGRQVPVKVYYRTIETTTAHTAPYLISKKAYGLKADLKLSPLHAFQSRKGVWQIPKYAALSNPHVKQYGIGSSVTYYHLECPNFFTDNLVVDGCVVESFGNGQVKGLKTLYKFNETLNGFTRASQVAVLKK
uniref:Fibronectin type-III domain-containing protein n=1 Tax=viral metagenome TaxID=1070528 RepID=A0A6C0DGR1_9ZZZZ